MRHVRDVRPNEELNDVLQNEAHADRRNERGELWCVAEGPVGKTFNQGADERHHHNGHGEKDDQADDQGWDIKDCPRLTEEGGAHANGNERCDHEDIAMGEVDEFNNAVDHGVAERDQRVDCAERHGVQELLKAEHAEHQREESGDDRRQEELAAHALCSYGACCCCH